MMAMLKTWAELSHRFASKCRMQAQSGVMLLFTVLVQLERLDDCDCLFKVLSVYIHCLILQEKLKPPLLACRIGRLYNKEAVIRALLEKALPPHMRHIKSLKDMKDCDVEVRPI